MNNEDQNQEIAYPASQVELADHCLELWEKYFASPKKEKAPIMLAYNNAAAFYNKRAGWKAMLMLTDSTKDSIRTRPIHVSDEHGTIIKDDDPVVKNVQTRGKGDGKVAQIKQHLAAGKTPAEIIALGFEKNTVNTQNWKFKNAK